MTTTKLWRYLSLLGIASALLIALPSPVLSQHTGNCEYVSETGYWVCDEFLSFYQAHGKSRFLGYPITRAFDDQTLGLHVQYFQRGRLELLPELPQGQRVRLGKLVDELGYSFPPAAPENIPPYNSGLHEYFPETEHVVSYAFLQYFRKNGGVEMFGYPRSEFLYQNDRIVQYFQSVRMEWHPEQAIGPGILLGDLGEVYLERYPVTGDYTAAELPGLGPDPEQPVRTPVILQLHADASVREIVTGPNSTQIAYAYVVDQEGRPVEGARVSASVRYGSESEPYDCGLTDSKGFCTCVLNVPSVPPGKRVVVDVTATFRKLQVRTPAFFTVWW
jgi:hypothetical protein